MCVCVWGGWGGFFVRTVPRKERTQGHCISFSFSVSVQWGYITLGSMSSFFYAMLSHSVVSDSLQPHGP